MQVYAIKGDTISIKLMIKTNFVVVLVVKR